jgi:hypothetical protein
MTLLSLIRCYDGSLRVEVSLEKDEVETWARSTEPADSRALQVLIHRAAVLIHRAARTCVPIESGALDTEEDGRQ